jgi:hypothetical protein
MEAETIIMGNRKFVLDNAEKYILVNFIETKSRRNN